MLFVKFDAENIRSQNDRVAKLLHCEFLYKFQKKILRYYNPK
jgi:hypothetical protein